MEDVEEPERGFRDVAKEFRSHLVTSEDVLNIEKEVVPRKEISSGDVPVGEDNAKDVFSQEEDLPREISSNVSSINVKVPDREVLVNDEIGSRCKNDDYSPPQYQPQTIEVSHYSLSK